MMNWGGGPSRNWQMGKNSISIMRLLSGVASVRSREEGRELQNYRYNSRGQVTGIVDGNGNQTGLDLDAWGRLMKIQAADGGVE